MSNPKYSKPSDAVIREKLSDLEYAVTQENATERPLTHAYYNKERSGI